MTSALPNPSQEGCQLSCDRGVLLFDLSINGHHPIYIQHLIRYWCESQISGQLNIVVSPKFMEKHSDVVEFAASYQQSSVQFTPISLEEDSALKARTSTINRNLRNFQEWKLLQKYTVQLRATCCLILYFDTYQLPIAFGATLPCSFSAIYFRPTFHYKDFAGYSPSYKNRLQALREKLLLLRVLAQPNLKTLFSLDPFAAKYLEPVGKANIVPLPDPVQTIDTFGTSIAELKADLNIEPERMVFLLFGAIDSRKGIYQVLEAVQRLPTELCQKICLVVVGQVKSTEKAQIEVKVALTRELYPVQIIYRNEFIAEHEISAYFCLADVVLATYQKHVGMSGILMLAAAAQKPTLSTDYGLMGEIVRRYRLGITVNSASSEAIAQGMAQFLLKGAIELCDRAQMKQFAEQNSPEHFAEVIFQHLLEPI